MSAPRATVRLQLNAAFTLDDAVGVVDYYASLGISHLYASPLQTARPGSTHGYDVIDYATINPELGGLDALRRLAAALRDRGMGVILDIVPNHMAASTHNAWWRDVLARGRASSYADYFDIDWESADPELGGKVLAPFLDRPLEDALADLRIVREVATSGYSIEIAGQRFPLAGASEADIGTRDRLREILARQHYVLAPWRDAATRINWRRFFDIGDLVAMRMDREEVFEASHALVFDLHAEGLIDGVRVDHVDGIADPRVYCERLRRGFERSGRAACIVVEKILGPDETLPSDWNVDGTTGYDFMDRCSAVLHDERGAAALDALWRELDGETAFEAYARSARREMATRNFAADLDALVRAWLAVEAADPRMPGIGAAAMHGALVRLFEHFERYRTYIEPHRSSAVDRSVLESAVARASAAAGEQERVALERFMLRLLADAPPALLLRRFQQLTPPIAAKAVEDTAFYRYGRLISRNEVGGEPACLALSAPAFHADALARREHSPAALVTTATHDHKRGEDVRARLAVLSELADSWTHTLRRWRAANAGLRTLLGERSAPIAADEAMLYQTIVGAWPCDLAPDDGAALSAFADRIAEWQRKALREAKRITSWMRPDADYESACERFLRALLDPSGPRVAEMAAVARRIAAAGAVNGLTQVLLRSTVPGTPDLYQGCDYWDFSLVDPDNRRPVDYATRRASLRDADWIGLRTRWRDGHVKQAVIAHILRWRAAHADLFAHGAYVTLTPEGPLAGHALAFLREWRGERLVVLATRHAAALLDEDEPLIAPARWADTHVRVQGSDRAFIDILTGRRIATKSGAIRLEDALGVLPIAALAPD